VALTGRTFVGGDAPATRRSLAAPSRRAGPVGAGGWGPTQWKARRRRKAAAVQAGGGGLRAPARKAAGGQVQEHQGSKAKLRRAMGGREMHLSVLATVAGPRRR
jgi:hypothetical protein